MDFFSLGTQEKISLEEGKLTNDTWGKAEDLDEQEYIVRNHFHPNNDKTVKSRKFGNFSKFYAVFDFFSFSCSTCDFYIFVKERLFKLIFFTITTSHYVLQDKGIFDQLDCSCVFFGRNPMEQAMEYLWCYAYYSRTANWVTWMALKCSERTVWCIF